jgi:hypothetical protein
MIASSWLLSPVHWTQLGLLISFEPDPLAQFQDNLIKADNFVLHVSVLLLLFAQHSSHFLYRFFFVDYLFCQWLFTIVLKFENITKTFYVLVKAGELQAQVLLHVLQIFQLYHFFFGQFLQIWSQLSHFFFQVLHLGWTVSKFVVQLFNFEFFGFQILFGLLQPFFELHNIEFFVFGNCLSVFFL